MKIYTEEQVKEILSDFIGAGHADNYLQIYYTPIELPSDEDLYYISQEYCINDGQKYWFEKGAKWMRDKIINQNK